MATTFNANQKGSIRHTTGNDWNGQPKFSSKKKLSFAIINFIVGQQDVSIRVDRSASKGKAEEVSGKFRILTPHNQRIKIGDKVEALNVNLRVNSIFPRYSLDGSLHHKQVDLELWQD